jgi:multicomponent Na+:H+ antiporter subunit D
LVAKLIAPKPKINLDTEWFFIKLCKALAYIFNKILVPAEYRYVGEFYRFLVDKMLVGVRNFLVSMNYAYLGKVATEVPQNVYNLSIKTSKFYDGNMLKYLQFLLIFLAILLAVIILI